MNPASTRFDRPSLEPSPWWATFLLLLAVVYLYPVITWDVYCLLGGRSPSAHEALWRPGLVYGTDLMFDDVNLRQGDWDYQRPAQDWDDASQGARSWRRAGGVRLPVAILGGALLWTVLGGALAVLAVSRQHAALGWHDHFARMAAWVVALYPWVYFAGASATGTGYPTLLGLGIARLIPFMSPASVWGLGFIVTGLIVAGCLYWFFNGRTPTVFTITGCDQFTNDPGRVLHGLPSLHGTPSPPAE